MDRMPLDTTVRLGQKGKEGAWGMNLCLLLPSSASMTSNSQARQCSFTSSARETCVGGRQYRAVPVPAVYPLHRSPNHLRLQLQLSLSARVQYIRVRVYSACGGCRTTGMYGRYEGVAAWVPLGQLVGIVESTNAKKLRQRQPKNI